MSAQAWVLKRRTPKSHIRAMRNRRAPDAAVCTRRRGPPVPDNPAASIFRSKGFAPVP